MDLPDGSPRLGPADYEDTYRAQEAIFGRGQDQGDLREGEPRMMAVVYQGAVDALLAHLDSHPDADLDHCTALAADTLLYGLTAPRP